MIEVACFCGCLFSFDGDAGACPGCGEVASVTVGPVLDSFGRNRPETPVPVVDGIGRDGQALEACPETADAGTPLAS